MSRQTGIQKNKTIFMKNLLKCAIALLLLVSSSAAFAQQQTMQQRTPEERAQRQTQMMQKNLALTDDQTQKVHDIILKHARGVDNARNSGGDMRSQMQGLNANKDEALKGVLTGDQYQKYLQIEQKMKEKRMQRNSDGMQPGGQ